MVQRDRPGPPAEGEAPSPPDPLEAALELQGLSLQEEEEEEGGARGKALPHGGGALPHGAGELLEGGPAVTSQLLFSRCSSRRLILWDPREPPRLLALGHRLQGSIGLQRSGSLPRRRGEQGGPPQTPNPRPRSGVLALQLDRESYSTCLQVAELERRVREALAERERLLQAREARRAAQAPPPAPELAPPPPEEDLAGYLRGRGHSPEGCRFVRVAGGSCRGPLTKRGGRIPTWRRRWFHLDPRHRVLAYYADPAQTKLKGAIYFQAIQEVYCHQGQPAPKSPAPRLTFCVKTFDRLFLLVAPSPEALRIWVDAVLALAPRPPATPP